MSYCVNCGVELDASATECALCNTPIVNPKDLTPRHEIPTPFPREKGAVEAVKKKDMGILLSTVVLATAVTCGILNALVFTGSLWSLAIIGVCVVLWVIMIPVVIYTKQPIYLSLLYDGVAVLAYLYMVTYMVDRDDWFFGLGLPIVILVTLLAETVTLCIRKLPRSILTIALYLFSAMALLIVGLEILIDRYLHGEISLSWSTIVLTICIIVDIAIITLLSRRRLRNAVRRRLHF